MGESSTLPSQELSRPPYVRAGRKRYGTTRSGTRSLLDDAVAEVDLFPGEFSAPIFVDQGDGQVFEVLLRADYGAKISVEDQGEHRRYAEHRHPDSGACERPQRIHLTGSLLATRVRSALTDGSRRFTCSGQMPNAITRAGRSRTGRKPRSILAAAGTEGAPSGLREEETTRRCATDWKACIMRVGNSRLSCTALRSRERIRPFFSGPVRIFAAATASAMARLMPTPPTGDMACAASPMQSSPGLCQRRRRSACTERSLTAFQSCSSSVRSARSGIVSPTDRRNASRPAPRTLSYSPFLIT